MLEDSNIIFNEILSSLPSYSKHDMYRRLSSLLSLTSLLHLSILLIFYLASTTYLWDGIPQGAFCFPFTIHLSHFLLSPSPLLSHSNSLLISISVTLSLFVFLSLFLWCNDTQGSSTCLAQWRGGAVQKYGPKISWLQSQG